MRAAVSTDTDCIYQFGEFRLDPAAKTLVCREEPVALTPKVFDTLQFLVENAGRLLEKNELMESLWQDRFVEESNLTFNIKMLRRALNDDAQHPRFIETVPRRGYRFVAEVTRIARTEAATGVATAPVADVTGRRPKYFWGIIFCLVAVVAVMALGTWLWQRGASAITRSAPILAAPFKSQKLTSAGSAHAVITPDGKYAAYVNESGGKESIWLRQLDTSENIQIVPPADVDYLGLAISHDGNSLYFVRRPRGDQVASSMYRVMTFGGIPTKITDQSQGWIDVSPDDQQISFVRCLYQPNDYCSLFVTGKDGHNERKVVTRQKPMRIGANKFSRDGKAIVFAAGQSNNGSKDFHFFRVDLTNGSENEFSGAQFFVVNHIAALPGTDAFLFSAEETLDGKSRVWELSANGEARPLTNDSTDYYDISLNRGGDRMVATHVSNSLQLHVAPLTDLGNPKVLVAARTVTFAPDDRLVYSGDDADLWTINRDGSNQRQLTNNSFNDFSPKLSPDGRYIFFASNRTGSNQVWRMNADGSDQIQITHSAGGYPEMVTADSRYVYYQSGLDQTLWQVAVDSGKETQLWDQNVYAPAFSPDGKQVAFCFRDTDKLLKIAIVGIEDRQILNKFALDKEYTDVLKMVWAQDSRSVIYIAVGSAGKFLWEQRLDGSPRRLLADLGRDEIESLALSSDGRTIAFTRGKWIHAALLIEGLK